MSLILNPWQNIAAQSERYLPDWWFSLCIRITRSIWKKEGTKQICISGDFFFVNSQDEEQDRAISSWRNKNEAAKKGEILREVQKLKVQ